MNKESKILKNRQKTPRINRRGLSFLNNEGKKRRNSSERKNRKEGYIFQELASEIELEYAV